MQKYIKWEKTGSIFIKIRKENNVIATEVLELRKKNIQQCSWIGKTPNQQLSILIMATLRKHQENNPIHNSFKTFLGINLTMETKELCNKDLKAVSKLKKTLEDRIPTLPPCSWISRINIGESC